LALLFILLFFSLSFAGELKYTIIEPPDTEALKNYMPCLMVYWDNTTTAFNEPVNVSIYVGKAKSADDAVDKWANNVAKLERMYKNIAKHKVSFRSDLYGNFLWSAKPQKIKIKYRTSKEGYSKDGWYIFTFSRSLTREDFYGEFFLSNDGILMPATLACTIINCCP
jgi:hypothetical protein